ncbi:MAG: hypothetical protein Q8Q01_00995 [archaeon]|nr:hypothetical protein [archaeon]
MKKLVLSIMLISAIFLVAACSSLQKDSVIDENLPLEESSLSDDLGDLEDLDAELAEFDSDFAELDNLNLE